MANHKKHARTKKSSDLQADALVVLESNGLSRTKSRLDILKVMMAGECILSADDIFTAVQKSGYDLTTIYRTLQTFEDIGVVTRVQLADGIARFELKTSDGHHHHHIICRTCKKIEVIDECIGDKLNKIGERLGFSKVEHSLEFYGICSGCDA